MARIISIDVTPHDSVRVMGNLRSDAIPQPERVSGRFWSTRKCRNPRGCPAMLKQLSSLILAE